MNKKWSLIIMLLVTLPVMASCGWLETVLAICRIEMKDGSSMEGVTYVATSTFDAFYHPNGFYLIYEYSGPDVVKPVIHGKTVIFNPDFNGLYPNSGMIDYGSMSQSALGSSCHILKAYYLRDITNKDESRSLIENTSIDSSSSPPLLKCDFIDHSIWELLDYVPVYPEVAKELLYGVTVKSIKEVHVPISKIDRFQLILEPSEKWLTQIENARIEIEKEYINNQNPDVPNPQWWHNLIKNMEYFKENFKPWRKYL